MPAPINTYSQILSLEKDGSRSDAMFATPNNPAAEQTIIIGVDTPIATKNAIAKRWIPIGSLLTNDRFELRMEDKVQL